MQTYNHHGSVIMIFLPTDLPLLQAESGMPTFFKISLYDFNDNFTFVGLFIYYVMLNTVAIFTEIFLLSFNLILPILWVVCDRAQK